MRRFANFYIILFVIDAVYSLVDELLVWFGMQMPLLTSVRMLIASLVIILSLIFYACLGIDRRLPKRVFLLMAIYISWCSLGLWPLSGVVERDLLPLLASVGQIAVAALIAVMMRGHLLLPESLFEKELFSMRNTLGFTAANLVLAPFLLIYMGLAVSSFYLEEQTAGFMRISPGGIYMAERSYHQNDKVIRLAGMMHVGRGDYYDDLVDSIPAKGTIILAEGVTDRENLLKHNLNYNKIAKVLGVSSQEEMRIEGNLVDLNNLDAAGMVMLGGHSKPDVARADIDVSHFEPSTIEFLNALGRTMQSDKPMAEALVEYNDWVNDKMTPEQVAGVMTDILDKRNEVIVASMVKILDRYDTIIIPWGALHMPAIEAAVLEQGFEPSEKKERLSLDFRTLPYEELWKKWQSGVSSGK